MGYISRLFTIRKDYKKGAVKSKVKGNVDAELVLHAMIEYENYDKAVIVSSDGDSFCLADYLYSQNKLLKILASNVKYSKLLYPFKKDNLFQRLDLLKKGLGK